MPRANADYIKNIEVPVPPYSEQRVISSFLDTECARIDAIIEKTRASIEEYKKLKQAVITEAVTKGIRPGRKMKDSGIEWIGEIPEEWEVRRIKTLFDLREEKNYLPLEEVNLISLYTDMGVVQHADLTETTGNKASNADGYKKVHEDDIVVNIILCWMGAIGRSAYSGVTSPAYDIYTPKEGVDSRFYHHYFRTSGFSGDCYKRGRGIMAMRWRTYSDQFRDIKVVYPSIEEQHEILIYLNDKCKEIDRLISSKQQILTELDNYKMSLIYEYVTGKKEVRCG
jgi:type I restriction enzyme S subunit